MLLKEQNTLWGIPSIHLKDYSKKYKRFIRNSFLYTVLFSILTAIVCAVLSLNIALSGYIVCSSCMIVFYILNERMTPQKWDAYRFYKRFSNCEIQIKTYNVTDDILYSILYCAGYKRLRQNKTLEEYKELMLSSCCEDITYSERLMSYLQKYESQEGSLRCIIIDKNKKSYFIDFENGGLINESDYNEADVTES